MTPKYGNRRGELAGLAYMCVRDKGIVKNQPASNTALKLDKLLRIHDGCDDRLMCEKMITNNQNYGPATQKALIVVI
jgi:hypothetical protein